METEQDTYMLYCNYVSYDIQALWILLVLYVEVKGLIRLRTFFSLNIYCNMKGIPLLWWSKLKNVISISLKLHQSCSSSCSLHHFFSVFYFTSCTNTWSTWNCLKCSSLVFLPTFRVSVLLDSFFFFFLAIGILKFFMFLLPFYRIYMHSHRYF